MPRAKPIFAALCALTIAGCGTVFEDQVNEVTQGVQDLRYGDAPPEENAQLVRRVQEQLQAEGIDPGPVDGVWGESTSQALRKFQEEKRLAQTGQLNPATLAALGVEEEEERQAGAGGSAKGER